MGKLPINHGPRPTSNRAKKIIRDEIKAFYGSDPQDRPYGSDYLLNMREDAEHCFGGRSYMTDWNKGSQLVNAGCFRVSYSDQREFLRQIYGNAIDEWENARIFYSYKNLIGREYASMLKERGLNKI